MLLRAIDRFFSHEASGGILLGLSAIAALIVANSAGAEQPIPVAQIDQRSPSTRSLMPDNFHEALTLEQLRDLVGFLVGN